MFRTIEKDLLYWKNQPTRKPLLLRGARQVGKSFIVEKFGREHFSNLVSINFEFERKFIACFETLDPSKIVSQIAIILQVEIKAHETLLFFDEIQECPRAILSLRYFKEMMPDLHVIGAGSLLEFTLNSPDFRVPVGRIQSLYMKPCSFKEYLIASRQQKLCDYISSVQLGDRIEPAIHQTLLEKTREYFILGGMPEVIANYIEYKDMYQCQLNQTSLLEYYRKDFGKYDIKVNMKILQQLFDKVPGMIAELFKYTKIDPLIQSREIKPALSALTEAGLIYPVYHTSASGLPLNTTINERRFKVLFLDIGLVHRASHLNNQILIEKDLLLLNRGQLAEQFVGQELLAYSQPFESHELFYWAREKPGSSAEVDYVINIGSSILPIEVKAGTTGQLKSMHLFLEEKKCNLGIRISQSEFSFKEKILSLPLYMIDEIPRLVISLTM